MISVRNISKKYGKSHALRPLSIDFRDGGTTALIGPSGCGKSTLLRVLINLIEPESGSVTIDGTEVTPANAELLRRKIGYVVQDGGLFPHLTARQNVSLLANFLGIDTSVNSKRIAELAELVQIPLPYLDRYPSGLSGGQRQRISLMRALMLNPNVLLLDEPLGALDPITRSDLQRQLKNIFVALNKTVILVTHDMGEAAYFGDEIVLMRSGEIVQKGTFDDLLRRPTEPYVSEFIQAQRSPLPPLSVE